MKVLFIHQSFPAQFLHIARDLVERDHEVVAVGRMTGEPVRGVRYRTYATDPIRHSSLPHVHEFESAVANGLAVHAACAGLRAEGFRPDVIVGHTGWGETLYVKDVWPAVPVLGYFEFYYHAEGADVGFDPEFPVEPDLGLRLRSRNATNLLSLDAVDWGLSATAWQRSLYPEPWRRRIQVLHEGVDTALARPDDTAAIWLADGTALRRGEEVVTFCARSLEPYRGFHTFMRALPRILDERPEAHVLIVGGTGVSYGRAPPDGGTWTDRMLAEQAGRLDLSRVHFLGRVPYHTLLRVLQVSAAHCYLTYPFVLSWSFIEALSVGCLTIASRTAPVEEVVRDGENGWLVDFFDPDALADTAIRALADRHGPDTARIRADARRTAIERYDMRTYCLPRYRAVLSLVAHGEVPLLENEG